MRWWQIRRRDEDLERELRSDLELEEEEQRENGLSPEDARRAAQRAFGNKTLIREQAHEAWGWARFERLWQDVRYGLRQLRHSWTFTVTVVLTLALGIGMNAAIFTMVDCVLLRPLGYRDANRIYSLNTHFLDENRSIAKIGDGDFADLAHGIHSLESVAYYNAFQDGLQTGGRTLYTDVAIASPQFGQVMGVEPVAGRLFLAGTETAQAGGTEAMVGAAFAREHFGSATGAVGQALHIEGEVRTIVGVLPDGFSFPNKTQVWIEVRPIPQSPSRSAYNQRAIGKVKPGVTARQLNAEMATLSKQLSATYPEDKSKALEAVPLQEEITSKIRPILRLLMAAVVVVLLIVCANIAHLQLVRATTLRREVTIRTALGATRLALARRAAVEVVLLALAGCVAGVMVAVPALKLLIRLAPPEIPRLGDVRLNQDVIAVSFLVSVVTMAVTALLPLWRSWRVDPASAMKQDAARGLESRGSGRLRQGLIVAEVALTLMLSVAATLLVRQLIAESRQDLGFAPEKLVMLNMHMISAPNGAADVQTLDRMVEGARGVPGVADAAAITGAPMSADIADVRYAVRGVSEFKPGVVALPDANVAGVTPNYFQTMQVPLMRGRGLSDADRDGSEPVLLVSESAARLSFPNADPIGKQVMFSWDSDPRWFTIIGVVGDVRQDSPASKPAPTFYLPIAQHPRRATDVQLMVRTHTDAATMMATITQFMLRQFPQVAVQGATMQDSIGESERAQHFRTLLFGSFAGVSILLAMTGMFGVTAYTVAQRQFEFALRLALGAQRPKVLGMVIGRTLAVAAFGVIGGVALSFAATRGIGALLGEMQAFDLVSYAVAIAVVLAIALAATVQPAWRAATVAPMRVLRDE
jgi:putative ABC transport system permease protein